MIALRELFFLGLIWSWDLSEINEKKSEIDTVEKYISKLIYSARPINFFIVNVNFKNRYHTKPINMYTIHLLNEQ